MLQGMYDYLRSHGVDRSGSTPPATSGSGSPAGTARRPRRGLPREVGAGRRPRLPAARRAAVDRDGGERGHREVTCATSFTGGPTLMVQYVARTASTPTSPADRRPPHRHRLGAAADHTAGVAEPDPDGAAAASPPHRIPADLLTATVRDIFGASGCAPDEATRIAVDLVDANLTGHDSHGVMRVPRYVDWLRAGLVHAGRTATVVADGGTFAVLDGQPRIRAERGDAGGVAGRRAGHRARDLRHRAARRRPHRTGRWLRGDRDRGRPDLDPLRERRGLAAGGTVRRGRAPVLHRPDRGRRSRCRATDRAGLRHLAGRRGEGAGRLVRRPAGAPGRADRAGRSALRRSAGALRRLRPHRPALRRPRGRAHCARSASTRAPGWP